MNNQQLIDELIPSRARQAEIMAMSDDDIRAACPTFMAFLDEALKPRPLAATVEGLSPC